MVIRLLCISLLLTSFGGAADAEPPQKVYVPNPTGDVRAKIGAVIASDVSAVLMKHGIQAFTHANLAEQLRQEEYKEVLQCKADDRCVDEVVAGFGVATRVFIQVTKLGKDSFHLELSLETKGRFKNKVTRKAKVADGALGEIASRMALELLGLKAGADDFEEEAIGVRAGDWNPAGSAKYIVDFRSTPPGAVVMVDGKLLCQDNSKGCSRTVTGGSHRVTMHKENHVKRTESVKVSKDTTVTWALEPDSGLLTVTAAPPGPGPSSVSRPGSAVERKPMSLVDFEAASLNEQVILVQERMSALRRSSIGKMEELLVAHPYYQNKAEIYFRLGEAHWEEAHFRHLLARKNWMVARDKFTKGLVEKKPVEPRNDQSVALKYFRLILAESPDYARFDQVLYYLGRGSLEAGRSSKDVQLRKEGVQYFTRMVQMYPKSSLIAQARLNLGDYYFETRSLDYARVDYEKIINNHPDAEMFNYALYKLAWVYFLLNQLEKSADTFEALVVRLTAGGKAYGRKFLEQALADLVLPYSQLDGGWRRAVEAYTRSEDALDCGGHYAHALQRRLASMGRQDEAAALARELKGSSELSNGEYRPCQLSGGGGGGCSLSSTQRGDSADGTVVLLFVGLLLGLVFRSGKLTVAPQESS